MPTASLPDARIEVRIDGDFVETDPDSDKPTETRARFHLRNPDRRMFWQETDDETIFVKVPARLVFFFSQGYKPVELKFRERTNRNDKHGFKNLVDRATIGATAETRNLHRAEFPNARWKILITIQNAREQIGVIDPEICNVNEDNAPAP